MLCNANKYAHLKQSISDYIRCFFHAQPVRGWLTTVNPRLLQQPTFAKATKDKCIYSTRHKC